MDGIAVAEHIRDRQPWLPVVIVSGYATDENEARARAAGVSTVLHKPLSPAMIEDSARDALRERRVHAPDAAVGLPAGAPRVAAEPRVGGADESLLRRLAVGFGAPTLGLLYVLVLPFAGLVTLAALPFWFGGRALARRVPGLATWIRNVGALPRRTVRRARLHRRASVRRTGDAGLARRQDRPFAHRRRVMRNADRR